jgi:integral membrane sensor domain MASE1
MTARLFDRKSSTGKPVLSKYGTYLRNTALVCIAYFASGRVGLAAPFTSGNVSPVWPASGIALSAVLLLGWRIWPGIALGAFLTNLLSPIPHIAAAGLALGNTLAALTGAFLLRRIPGFRHSLSRLMDILQLVTLGALTSPIVSASIGVATLLPRTYNHGKLCLWHG